MTIQQRGFTLLEVLVAAFILFLVIATMTMVYRGAMGSSLKAQRVVQMSALVPQLRNTITERLAEVGSISRQEGEGSMDGVYYQWQALPMLRGQPYHPDNRFVVSSGANGNVPASKSSFPSYKSDDGYLGMPAELEKQAEPQLDPTGRPLGMESTTLWLWRVSLTLQMGNAQRQYEFWTSSW